MKSMNQTMKKNNSDSPSDLQRLILEFEAVTHDLKELDLADKDERDTLEAARTQLLALQESVNGVLAGNMRARRERLIKLSNLQELLTPILFPVHNECPESCAAMCDEALILTI